MQGTVRGAKRRVGQGKKKRGDNVRSGQDWTVGRQRAAEDRPRWKEAGCEITSRSRTTLRVKGQVDRYPNQNTQEVITKNVI